MNIENKKIEFANSIEEIAKIERELNEQLINAGWDSVKRVLSDMYKEPSHFIFELLQNAENVLANEVNIYLYDDRLVFTHNGVPFSLNDIKRICQAGNINEEDTKGKFGIGFKSVYKITKAPFIYSLNDQNPSFKIEDYNVPIRVVPDKTFNLGTKFVLFFDADENTNRTYKIVKDGLDLLNEDAIMFSDNIKKITLSIDDKMSNTIFMKSNSFDISKENSFSKLTIVNKQKDLNYLLFQKDITFFDAYKKKEVTRKISIAYPDPKFDIEDSLLRSTKLSVLFPTEVDTGLRFKIDAPFNTSYTREQVSFANNDFNQMILNKTLELYEYSILSLKKHNLFNIDLIYYLAISPKLYYYDSIYTNFYNKTIDIFNNNELLLSNDGMYIKSSIALLCHDNKMFMELLSEKDLKSLFDGRYKWIDATGIRKARDDELRKFLTDNLKIIDVEFNRINSRLTEQFFDDKDDQWLMKFYDICLLNVTNIMNNPKPIIRNINNKMKIPLSRKLPNVFLPSKFVRTNEKAIKKVFLDDETSMSFFKKLGIKEASAIDAIKEEWIPLLKSLSDDRELNDTIEEIFRIIYSCPTEQKDSIIGELGNIDFFPCKSLKDNALYFSKPKEIYANTSFLREVLTGTDAKLVIEEIQRNIDNNSWLKEIMEKLKINSTLKIIERNIKYYHALPKKVVERVKSEYSDYEISTQKSHSFKECEIEFLDSILSNLSQNCIKFFWDFLNHIPLQYFTSSYAIFFKYCNEVARGTFTPLFIEKLNEARWVLINGEKLRISEITKNDFRSYFTFDNNELERQLNFIIDEDTSNLSEVTKEKVELTKDRSPEELRQALKLLDDKIEQERLALLKEEYLIHILVEKMNIQLTDIEIGKINSFDFSNFNASSNQIVIFEILKNAGKSVRVFNSISDLKFDSRKYFEMLMKRQLALNEKKWVSSAFKRYKEEGVMSNKLKFSEDMITYQQFDFDLTPLIENLDINFDYSAHYETINFLRFNDEDPEINVAEEYNKNLKIFMELLTKENINNLSLSAMLNYPSQKSLMYLGEFDELLKRYKSFITEKDDGEKIEIPNLDNVTLSNVKTSSVYVREGNSDSTGTKIDIQKAGSSKSITGITAETIIFKFLSERVPGIIQVEWDSENADSSVNPNGRAGLGYDIKYKRDGITYYVEVKGTKNYTDKLMLNFSKNEIKFAKRHQDVYQIMICNGAISSNPKIQIIENIFDKYDFAKRIEGDGFIALPSGYEIYLEIK